jgi:hypothetical protein
LNVSPPMVPNVMFILASTLISIISIFFTTSPFALASGRC